MMRQRPELTRYNSGVIALYRPKDRKTDFNARRNVQTLDDLDFIVRLDYEQKSKRQQDVEFAEQAGFALTEKVQTRLFPGIDNKCMATIGTMLYSVAYIDVTETDMFLYLEGVKQIAE